MGFCGNSAGQQLFREVGAGSGGDAVKASRKMDDSTLGDPLNDSEDQANAKTV